MKGSAVARVWFLYSLIGLVSILLVSKIFIVQVLNAESYTQHADRQYVAPRVDDFDRGTIYFSEKNGERVSAATLKTGFTLAINPKALEAADDVYAQLSAIVDVEYEDFMYRAALTDDPYEVVAKRLEPGQAEAIEELQIDGVILSKEKWRYYPAGTRASHVLGFVGYQGDTLAGRYGLERRYNDILRRDTEELYVNFFAEVFSNIRPNMTINGSSNRKGDVVTTIEPTVQKELESELLHLLTQWNAESGGGIIMHPQTGAIEAIAALPTYDPNTYNSENDQLVFSNPLLENVYEMGSIIKPLTVAAGLDSNAVSADSTYTDYGYVELNGEKIQNYDGRARGVVNMQEVLNQSLNTGVVHIMQQMGHDTFREYMEDFNMGNKTRIDLPNETKGLVGNLKSGRDIEYATASFGQGVAVTPINMTQMLAVLGNGGVLVTPHIVKEIDYEFGFSNELTQDVPTRVIREETSEEITRMLVEVTDTALRGGAVKMDGYSIAAKTGTAQIADPENGGYYEDKYLHSFFGYFPAYNPEFLVFLYVINPREVRYASETLTNPFMDITKFLINYYEILPDR
jgi:cell division protein FtsI/penicillin-binding protein 2